MTMLTDMQRVLLTTACQREDGSLLPLPDSLGVRAARLRKAVEVLIRNGLAAEQQSMAAPQAWRIDGDLIIGVIITDAGRTLIDPPVAEEATVDEAEELPAVTVAPAAGRPGTKQAKVIDLLKRERGATLAEIVGATGWLPHTSRAVLTGLRKKGHVIGSEKVEGVTRYQITAA